LRISKIALPSSTQVGGWVTFYLVYRNDGATAINNVTLTDVISGTCFSQSGTSFNLGTLAPGASSFRTFAVQTVAAGTCTNTATINAAGVPIASDSVTVVVTP
jgi:uncharacterized repeat protein (TIGR01451 family)